MTRWLVDTRKFIPEPRGSRACAESDPDPTWRRRFVVSHKHELVAGE
jgi:hypothetical protein